LRLVQQVPERWRSRKTSLSNARTRKEAGPERGALKCLPHRVRGEKAIPIPGVITTRRRRLESVRDVPKVFVLDALPARERELHREERVLKEALVRQISIDMFLVEAARGEIKTEIVPDHAVIGHTIEIGEIDLGLETEIETGTDTEIVVIGRDPDQDIGVIGRKTGIGIGIVLGTGTEKRIGIGSGTGLGTRKGSGIGVVIKTDPRSGGGAQAPAVVAAERRGGREAKIAQIVVGGGRVTGGTRRQSLFVCFTIKSGADNLPRDIFRFRTGRCEVQRYSATALARSVASSHSILRKK